MMYLSWDVFAIMGITISFLIVTLIFMLSYMFNSEFLKSWSRGEFLNIFITLILFGTLISIVQMGVLKENLNAGKDYVSDLFEDVIESQIKIISHLSLISFIGSFSININPGGVVATQNQVDGGTGGVPLSGYISLNAFVSPIITSVSSIQIYSFIPLLMIKLHILLIEFVSMDAARTVPIFLGLGIFLRSFKFSRGAGNTMIAIFLALYLVLPTIYIFNLGLMNTVYGNTTTNKIFEFHSFNKDIGYGNDGSASDFMPEMIEVLMQGISSDLDISDMGSDAFKKTDFVSALMETTGPGGKLYNFIMRFVMEAFFLPYLSIIITLGIAREFALTLGSNVDFSSLVRLV
jgi:hypothetical protein